MLRLLRGSTVVAYLVLLVACGSGSSEPDGLRDPAAGLLRAVSGAEDLERSIKAGFTTIRNSNNDEAAIGVAADSSAGFGTPGNFTGTYTQELDVDESDAVRYDGELLFVAPRRFFNCCFAFASADGAVPAGGDPQRSIRILSTDPQNAAATLASSIPLEDNVSVQGMYLKDDRLFALTGESIYGTFGGFWTDIAIWAPETLGYRVYDTSDPSVPELLVDASIEGIFVESRRIGDTVYIVSRYSPSIDGLEYYVTTAEQQAKNESLLADVSIDRLLPSITINGVTRSLVSPDRCYVTNDGTDAGYPVVTSVTAVPISDPTSFTTTCYNEEAYGIYVSPNAIYFPQFVADATLGTTNTRVHKFALLSNGLDYRGSAEVDGQVWTGGQADFRLSEHDGDLRLIASQFDWNSDDFVDHKLYVLRESASEVALEIVSELPNSQRPQEIGKPNEALYGVRFLSDRAYAVTFEQIDPLYVIDIEDPADPQIAGELEVTGFSDFLHPIGNELLLGLGTAATGAVKVELFDTSDIDRPLSRGALTIGDRGSYSEANYDRHAFTYQSDINGVDRFSIPVTTFGGSGDRSALHLFEIRDKGTPGLASLIGVGSLSPPENGTVVPIAIRSRAVFHDDTVYYVRDDEVWAGFWNSPTAINGPF